MNMEKRIFKHHFPDQHFALQAFCLFFKEHTIILTVCVQKRKGDAEPVQIEASARLEL